MVRSSMEFLAIFCYINMRNIFFLILTMCLGFGAIAQDKPYISGTSLLKIYSTDGGIGMTIEPKEAPVNDILTLKGGDYLTVTISTLDTYYVVSGKLALAITRGNEIVEILAQRTIPSSISSISFVHFSFIIDEGTEILPGDEIRLLTTYNEVLYSTVDAAYGHEVVDRIPCYNYQLPLYNINYPTNVEGVMITPSADQAWTNKAIKGRNFYLYIEKENADDVLVVRANGNAWVPSNGVYMLSGVMQDYDIDIKVYKKEECNFYRVITATEEERVVDLLSEEELDYTKGLKVKGVVKTVDFQVFRNQMPSIEVIDLSEAKIENDYLPEGAFELNSSITEVVLPEGLVGFANNAFRYVKNLKQIVLPSSLNVFGYNAFFGCESLEKVWAKWNPIDAGMEPPLGFPIPPCAFRATLYKSSGLLIVPKGCLQAYKNAANWGEFKTIREEAPVDKILMEKSFSRFNPVESVIIEKTIDEIKVRSIDGGCLIVLDAPKTCQVLVTDLSGKVCKRMVTTDERTIIPLHAGFYIVTVEGKSHKVVVL